MKGFVFIGKGGVGKTTCGAALALKLAERGRTLIASLDPAHNLGDVYGVKLGNEPKKITKNLYAAEIDIDLLTKRYLERTTEKIKSMYSYLKVLNLDKYVDSLKYSPGIEEYSVLEGLIELISSNYDYLVLDMPPTGLTIKVLTLPYTALIWIEKLTDLRREILKRRRAIEDVIGKRFFVVNGKEVEIPVEENDDPVMIELREKKEKMSFVSNFLSRSCSIILVVNPEPLSLFEGKRAIEALGNFKLKISRVVINKFTHENEVTIEAEKLGKTIKVPLLSDHPRGLKELKSLSELLEGLL